jgi:Flp pilus assembly protein TadG
MMRLCRSFIRCGAEGRRGQVLIIFALMFTVLVGFAGLALDATHLYLSQHTAQNAADAAVLAAGKRLAGKTQTSPLSNQGSANDSAIAAHDFAAADGFMTARNLSCDATSPMGGGRSRFTTTWYDTTVSCGAPSGFNWSVSLASPPWFLTPHCQSNPYNCVQVTVTQNVQNLIMGAVGFPTTKVSASATAYAQPTGVAFSTPAPYAVYLYEASGAACTGAGYTQCFNQGAQPSRSQLSCTGGNCPTVWVRNGGGIEIVGVDGSTVPAPRGPAHFTALQSNGDVVLGSVSAFCDPYGVGASGCNSLSPVGTNGFAVASPGKLYCSGPWATSSVTAPACTNIGPGSYSLSVVDGNEVGFAGMTWNPTIIPPVRSCGFLILNGDPVHSHAGLNGACDPGPSEPYNILPGNYDYIVINHGQYTFEPGLYDIWHTAPHNSVGAGGQANGIDHSGETSNDWDLCSGIALGACTAKAGVWVGGNGNTWAGPLGTTNYGACGISSTQLGGGGSATSVTGHGVTFRFESTSAGFVSTQEVTYIALTSPGLGQSNEVGGAPLLFDMENDHFIHIDANTTRANSSSATLNQFSGIIYQYSGAKAGGVEVDAGFPTRHDGEEGGTANNTVQGQIIAYSLTTFGSFGAFDFSNGTGGATTPSVTTSGNQENQILTGSKLVPGPTPTTESLVITYADEWALDAYDAYVTINNGPRVFFSAGIWNPQPASNLALPPAVNTPGDSADAYPNPLTQPGAVNYNTALSPDANGDPNWIITFAPTNNWTGAPKDNSTFQIEGDWAWGHERNILTAVRGNNVATLTYTFPVPSSGTTVSIGMFMTDGDRCGDYVTSTWTFTNMGTPSPGVQVIGTVRLEQ